MVGAILRHSHDLKSYWVEENVVLLVELVFSLDPLNETYHSNTLAQQRQYFKHEGARQQRPSFVQTHHNSLNADNSGFISLQIPGHEFLMVISVYLGHDSRYVLSHELVFVKT